MSAICPLKLQKLSEKQQNQIIVTCHKMPILRALRAITKNCKKPSEIFLAPACEIYYPRAQIHCNTERNKTVIQKYAVSEILVLLIRNSYAHSIDQPSLKAAFTSAERGQNMFVFALCPYVVLND